MKQFLLGASYIFLGFRYLFHPSTRKLVWIPIFVNVFIFVGAMGLGYVYITSRLDSFFTPVELPTWLSWLQGMLNWLMTGLKGLFAAIWFALFLFLFSVFGSLTANLIASPFTGMLTEKFDESVNQFKASPQTMTKLIIHSVLRELHKWLYYLPRLLLVGILWLVFYFVPVANIFTTGLLYLFGIWMLAFQYLDYPADNRQIKVKDLKKQIKANRMISLGFGLSVFCFTLIPGINFIILPLATLSATKLWADQFNKASLDVKKE